MIGLENYYKLRHDSERQSRYDEVWVIMLYPPKDVPAEFKHVPELAPTRALYKKFWDATKTGTWSDDRFQSEYVPEFLRDLVGCAKGVAMVELLLAHERAGHSIALACTCHKENTCHRSIIGGIIQGMCPDVTVVAEEDYSRYWRMMNAM